MSGGMPAGAQEIPTLPAVLDPLELAKHLDLFSRPPWNWGELKHVQVEVLKSCHRDRWTLEILLRTTGEPRALIGKVYAQDRSDVHETMKAISRAGFGRAAEFSIPRPLAYLPALNLLLQEKVEGVRAKDIFVHGNERDRAEAAERCALWLARFHRAAPRSGPVSDPTGYVLSLQHWSHAIAARGEPLADQAARLLERLRGLAATLGPYETCAGHGSYYHAQIIFASGRTATFDWDRHDVADPARDVARFLVALARLAVRYLGSIRALDPAAEVFLKTYLAKGRRDVQARLPFYQAATCVKLASYEIPRAPCPSRTTIIQSMLDEGFRILERWR